MSLSARYWIFLAVTSGLVLVVGIISGSLVRNALGAEPTPELSAAFSTAWWLSLSAAGIIGALGVLFFQTSQRSVRRVVDETASVAGAVKAGDLGVRADVTLVDQDLRVILDNLNATLGAMGNLEKLRAWVGLLERSSRELREAGSELGRSAEETSTRSSTISVASDQVNRSVQTLATGSEEMTASINEIAKNAYKAANVAEKAVQVAEQTNRRVRQLGDSSSEIGKIVTVISSVAEQTNLLALNATIEAARAGKAGKGFAVVANEVKELAKETAKATEDISRRVEAIQTDTARAIDSIREINEIINQINDFQNMIASAVEEQGVTSGEFGRHIAELATGSAEIASKIKLIAETAQGTATGVGLTQRASGELSDLAHELAGLTGRSRETTAELV